MTSRTPVEKLVRRLDLAPLAEDCFLGHTGRGEGRVFGGLLAAQGLVAAGRTVADGAPHSLHLYFVRSGRHGMPLTWSVTRVRDGFTFALRHVVAEQSGQVILTLTASFTTKRAGLAHQEPMPPDVPAPEGLADWEDLRVQVLGPGTVRRPDGPLEVRDADPASATPAPGRPACRRLWMRTRQPLPDSPLLHAAVLAYATDRGLLSTAGRPHGLKWGTGLGASLDHTVWFHRPARVDDWVLYDMVSPVAVAGRGFCQGALYARDGARIASVTQEGLIRILPRRAGH